MRDCTDIIHHLLVKRLGYSVRAKSAQQLAKKLAQNNILQHYANGLELELLRVLKESGKKMPARSRKQKNNKHNVDLKKTTTAKLPDREIKMRVSNLLVGKPFSEKIIPIDDCLGSLKICYVKGDKDIPGLIFDDSELVIKGTIDQAGDHEIILYCLLLLPDGKTQKVLGTLKITVIPDPRSLWKDIPSDETARFHKPDFSSSSGENDVVRLLGSSVRGRSHAHKGTHRDDDFRLSCSGSSGWNILCVADGAGSCKYSRRGAEIVARHCTRTLRETLDGHYGELIEAEYDSSLAQNPNTYNSEILEIFRHTILKAVIGAAIAIEKEVDKEEGDQFKDFSTTLLLAAHKPVDGGHLILSFWIGDGGAVIYDKGKSIRLLGEPDSGEYAGQTRFLDKKLFEGSDIYSRVIFKKVETMTALILATDGITDAWFETEQQLGNIEPWDALWLEWEPILRDNDLKNGEANLTQWMEFWSPGNHDDRSVAICWVKD